MNARPVCWIVTAALLFVMTACASPHILEKAPVPKDRPLYGYTPEGVFFIHESLIENTGGQSPVLFAPDVMGGVGRKMTHKPPYYVYEVKSRKSDKLNFEDAKGKLMNMAYFFGIGGGRQIPRAVYGRTDWVPESDTWDNPRFGRVFNTPARDNPYLPQ